jgi:hypothetical protein
MEISNQEEKRVKEKEEYERMYRDLESSVAAEKEKLEYLFKEKLDISN